MESPKKTEKEWSEGSRRITDSSLRKKKKEKGKFQRER